jgi:hypothetical protein
MSHHDCIHIKVIDEGFVDGESDNEIDAFNQVVVLAAGAVSLPRRCVARQGGGVARLFLSLFLYVFARCCKEHSYCDDKNSIDFVFSLCVLVCYFPLIMLRMTCCPHNFRSARHFSHDTQVRRVRYQS